MVYIYIDIKVIERFNFILIASRNIAVKGDDLISFIFTCFNMFVVVTCVTLWSRNLRIITNFIPASLYPIDNSSSCNIQLVNYKIFRS